MGVTRAQNGGLSDSALAAKFLQTVVNEIKTERAGFSQPFLFQ
jgi:hypothetical protein